jgi:hypothetical protein
VQVKRRTAAIAEPAMSAQVLSGFLVREIASGRANYQSASSFTSSSRTCSA